MHRILYLTRYCCVVVRIWVEKVMMMLASINGGKWVRVKVKGFFLLLMAAGFDLTHQKTFPITKAVGSVFIDTKSFSNIFLVQLEREIDT
jgi:hypothetical protein